MTTDISQRYYGDTTLYRRLARECRPYARHILLFLFITMLAGPILALMPIPLRIGFDSFIGNEPVPGFVAWMLPQRVQESKQLLLYVVIAGFVAVGFAQQLQTLSSTLIKTYTSEHLLLWFRAKLFRHSQSLSLGFHDSKGVADSLYRIQYDAMAVEAVTMRGLVPMIGAATQLVLLVVVSIFVDWELTVIAMAVGPVLAVTFLLYRRALRSHWNQLKVIESSILGVIEEVLTSIRVVKAFGQELREQERFKRTARAGIRAKMRVVLLQGSFGVFIGLAIAIGTSFVFYVGLRHVQTGVITLGQLTQVMLYLTMLYKPMEQITTTFATLQQALAAANRSFALLEENPEVVEKRDAIAIEKTRGDVRFENVSFFYDEEQPVLSEISFDAPRGSRVGISGRTGSGKTTLISLLMRFYDPSAGRILLDGVDLRDYRLDDLRKQYSIVLQDTILFAGSVAENIAYGRPEARREEIVEAARLANADGFVAAMPDGYDTEVGAKGMRLSGGERQRVSLARAFLRNAPILILDEPTSSVDVGTEALVMDAIERLMEGRTTFMISHRPNTLENCDVRLELDAGRLVGA